MLKMVDEEGRPPHFLSPRGSHVKRLPARLPSVTSSAFDKGGSKEESSRKANAVQPSALPRGIVDPSPRTSMEHIYPQGNSKHLGLVPGVAGSGAGDTQSASSDGSVHSLGSSHSGVIETSHADLSFDENGNESQINDYRIVSQLGRGAFSQVHLAEKVSTETGGLQKYAIKVINKSLLKRRREFKMVNGKMVMSNAFAKVEMEIAIMKKLRHPNLVRLFEVIDDPNEDKLMLVLQYIPNGQVMYWSEERGMYMNRETNGPLSEAQAAAVICDVTLGLEYLHANHIAHRDIKPENILIGDQNNYMIADMGVAHLFQGEKERQGSQAGLQSSDSPGNSSSLEDDVTHNPIVASDGVSSSSREPSVSGSIGGSVELRSLRLASSAASKSSSSSTGKAGFLRSSDGTVQFMAPESTTGEEFDAYTADIWSLGVTLYALLTGKCPFSAPPATGVAGLLEAIRTQTLDLPNTISPAAQSAIQRMLSREPASRIRIEEMKALPWLGIETLIAQRGRALPPPVRVAVSTDEVRLAFTPATNLFLMAKLKMRMSKRLANARRTLNNKKKVHTGRVPSPTRGPSETSPSSKSTPASASPSSLTVRDEDINSGERKSRRNHFGKKKTDKTKHLSLVGAKKNLLTIIERPQGEEPLVTPTGDDGQTKKLQAVVLEESIMSRSPRTPNSLSRSATSPTKIKRRLSCTIS